jgi:hypothetical protein
MSHRTFLTSVTESLSNAAAATQAPRGVGTRPRVERVRRRLRIGRQTAQGPDVMVDNDRCLHYANPFSDDNRLISRTRQMWP